MCIVARSCVSIGSVDGRKVPTRKLAECKQTIRRMPAATGWLGIAGTKVTSSAWENHLNTKGVKKLPEIVIYTIFFSFQHVKVT